MGSPRDPVDLGSWDGKLLMDPVDPGSWEEKLHRILYSGIQDARLFGDLGTCLAESGTQLLAVPAHLTDHRHFQFVIFVHCS